MKVNGIEVSGCKYSNALSQFAVEHVDRMAEHYAHAIEKHPYFCDCVYSETAPSYIKQGISSRLAFCRERNKLSSERGRLGWDDLLDCGLWEVFGALADGDKAHAVEHLYKMVADILRTIDVLEGRQKLGKPEEIKK